MGAAVVCDDLSDAEAPARVTSAHPRVERAEGGDLHYLLVAVIPIRWIVLAATAVAAVFVVVGLDIHTFVPPVPLQRPRVR